MSSEEPPTRDSTLEFKVTSNFLSSFSTLAFHFNNYRFRQANAFLNVLKSLKSYSNHKPMYIKGLLLIIHNKLAPQVRLSF